MRVAVTTTLDAADRIAHAVEQIGLEPVRLPCIRVEPAPADTIARLRAAADEADWIIVTARRAVEIVWPGGDMPGSAAVAAVGRATAAAARSAGGRVAVVGDGGAAALRELLGGRVDAMSVVFPHARAADPATVRWLKERTALLTADAAYETIPVAPAQDTVDSVIFGSPSAVDGWCEARPLDGLVIAAMGRTTARYLEGLGHPPDVVPATPRLEELVSALGKHLSQPERHRP